MVNKAHKYEVRERVLHTWLSSNGNIFNSNLSTGSRGYIFIERNPIGRSRGNKDGGHYDVMGPMLKITSTRGTRSRSDLLVCSSAAVVALVIGIYIVVACPLHPDQIREMVALNEMLGKTGVHNVINPLEQTETRTNKLNSLKKPGSRFWKVLPVIGSKKKNSFVWCLVWT